MLKKEERDHVVSTEKPASAEQRDTESNPASLGRRMVLETLATSVALVACKPLFGEERRTRAPGVSASAQPALPVRPGEEAGKGAVAGTQTKPAAATNTPTVGWGPFIDGSGSELVIVQHVGYEGAHPGSLFLVAPGASLGGYLKRSRALVERLSPTGLSMTKEWRDFLSKHRLRANDDEDEPSADDVYAALQQESDTFVLRSLSESAEDSDAEGEYTHRFAASRERFLDLTPQNQRTYFAPATAKLFQVVCSHRYGYSESVFVRGKDKGQVLRYIVERRQVPLLQKAFGLLCSLDRVSGRLPDDREEREQWILKASPAELAAAFSYAYTKGDFQSIAISDVSPPYVVV